MIMCVEYLGLPGMFLLACKNTSLHHWSSAAESTSHTSKLWRMEESEICPELTTITLTLKAASARAPREQVGQHAYSACILASS